MEKLSNRKISTMKCRIGDKIEAEVFREGRIVPVIVAAANDKVKNGVALSGDAKTEASQEKE